MAKKKHRFLKVVVIGAGVAGVAYAVARKQRPGPCIAAGGPEERILVKDQENLSGLGLIMQNLAGEFVKSPAKLALLDTMNVSVAIEPTEQPESAITMTFSDGYLVIEPGVVASPDIKIMCDIESLLQMAGMGTGLAALKFMASPEGQQMVNKFMSGQIKVEGLAAHPLGMLKFSSFLAPSPA
jgi:heterodisulfide reductase subunit A-like polyferredoxin